MHPDIPLGRRMMIDGSQQPMTQRSSAPARGRKASPLSPMPASSCHATDQVHPKVTVVAELRGCGTRALPLKPFINIALEYRCLNLSAGEGR
jgi:hypothetical protein